MYIIIQNECIDTSLLKKMKLYGHLGIIAFVYQNPNDGQEIELPVTFDDAFEAELVFDHLEDSFIGGSQVEVVTNFASVPTGLLAKMRRGVNFCTNSHKNCYFESKRGCSLAMKEAE